MYPVAVVFLSLAGGLLLALPRRWAPLPLLMGACYMTQAQGVEIGPFSFPFLRLLILVGFLRVLVRRELAGWRWTTLDTVAVLFALWAMASSLWHPDPVGALIFRSGLAYDYCGLFFLFRSFLRSPNELLAIARIAAIVLLPVAAEMVYEKAAGQNLFSAFGGVPATPVVREGHTRAQGPFRHAILAGTVGGVMFPWMVALWWRDRRLAKWGGLGCLAMVFASRSSGPIGSWLAGIVALLVWPWRFRMRRVRWLAVSAYVGLEIVMKAPAYYLIARVDLAGGSTGWHRARLIESAIDHLPEWWWAGTDYTRHWMPTGVSWSPEHTDITNLYLQMGVVGGLPLMILLILLFTYAFAHVGRAVRVLADRASISSADQVLAWCVGASLFAQAVTGLGVSYFDQSFLFLCLVWAASAVPAEAERKQSPARPPFPGTVSTTEQLCPRSLRIR